MYKHPGEKKFKTNRIIQTDAAKPKHQKKPMGSDFLDNRTNRGLQIAARPLSFAPVSAKPLALKRMVTALTPVSRAVLQAAWDTSGVNLVLDKDTAGRQTVIDLNNQKYTVIKFSGGTYYRQYFKDKAKTIKDGPRKLCRVNGWHNRVKKIIAIKGDHTPNIAASTLVHEVAHANQHQQNEQASGTKPFPGTKEKEYDAHIKQDYFNKAAGIPPKKAEFRDKDGNVNETKIKEYVDRVYAVGTKARPYKKTKKTYVALETIKPWPAI